MGRAKYRCEKEILVVKQTNISADLCISAPLVQLDDNGNEIALKQVNNLTVEMHRPSSFLSRLLLVLKVIGQYCCHGVYCECVSA